MALSAQRGLRRFGVVLALSVAVAASSIVPGAQAAEKRTAVQRAAGSADKSTAVQRATRSAKRAVARGAGSVRAKSAPNAARANQRSVAAARSRNVQVRRPSIGHAFGLHAVDDPLSLASTVALVLDQRSGEVLFEKNSRAVLPIASISKLMTAVVVLDAQLPMDEILEISEADVDTERNTRSRLRTGTRLSRTELLQLALMSSENRAAHALGRNHPGGLAAFVAQMNRKARELGMTSSGFVEPTGLSSSNVSSARDLALLVQAAFHYPLIREYSTASALSIDTGARTENYRNTNRLVDRADWEIGLQKTGFISEAGNCLVMQTRIDDRPLVLVLLDAQARVARIGDAKRIRSWLERMPPVDVQRVAQPPASDEPRPATPPRARTSV